MRVVAGDFGGRRLKEVPGIHTRSTTDKVKEATFHRIGPFFQGGTCLDLFAGSGALGLEALSRGMDHALFIDTHAKAIRVIHENVQTLNVEEQSTIKRKDAMRALEQCAKDGEVFDLILIDPPFHAPIYEKVLRAIDTFNLLHKNGIIYCEHDRQLEMDWDLLPFTVTHESTYGTISTKLLTH